MVLPWFQHHVLEIYNEYWLKTHFLQLESGGSIFIVHKQKGSRLKLSFSKRIFTWKFLNNIINFFDIKDETIVIQFTQPPCDIQCK